MTMLDTRFADWTAGMTREVALVEVFSRVRDILYMVGAPPDPERTLRENAGNCYTKHIILKSMLDRLNFETLYATCDFKWEDQAFLPQELRQAAKGLEPRQHFCLAFNRNGHWLPIDATWDRELEKLAFLINYWDGRSETCVAVQPASEMSFFRSLPSKRDYSSGQREFYEKLARWFADLRIKGVSK